MEADKVVVLSPVPRGGAGPSPNQRYSDCVEAAHETDERAERNRQLVREALMRGDMKHFSEGAGTDSRAHPTRQSWTSGYIPRSMGPSRRSSNLRRSTTSTLASSVAKIRSSVRRSLDGRGMHTTSSTPWQRRSLSYCPSTQKKPTVQRQLNFSIGADGEGREYEAAVNSVHSGVDSMIGRLTGNISDLQEQLSQLLMYWRRKRPSSRVVSLSDFMSDLDKAMTSLDHDRTGLENRLVHVLSEKADAEDALRVRTKESSKTICDLKNANAELEATLKAERDLMASTEADLKSIAEMKSKEADEMNKQCAQMSTLVTKIEEAESRVIAQAQMCHRLQDQIRQHQAAKSEYEGLEARLQSEQLDRERERASFEEALKEREDTITQLRLEMVPARKKRGLRERSTNVDDGDGERGAFETPDKGKAKLRLLPEEGPFSEEESPSKQSFHKKLEYFAECEGSRTPLSACKSPSLLAGLEARATMEAKRNLKIGMELKDKISEATLVLKEEFEKHTEKYKQRILQLEEALEAKDFECSMNAGTEPPNMQPGAGVDTMGLASLFPEHWEEDLIDLMPSIQEDAAESLQTFHASMQEALGCQGSRSMEGLQLQFQGKLSNLQALMAAFEEEVLGKWKGLAESSPLDFEVRAGLQNSMLCQLHELEAMRHAASFNDRIRRSSHDMLCYISNELRAAPACESDPFERKMDAIVFGSWERVLDEIRGMHDELQRNGMSMPGPAVADQKEQTGLPPGESGDETAVPRRVSMRSTSSVHSIISARSDDFIRKNGQYRSYNNNFMGFSPGRPFLPGEREANLRLNEPPLREQYNKAKSPTNEDIRELVNELMEYYGGDDDKMNALITSIQPCAPQHLKGSYTFGTKNIKLVILNDLLMVRVGGGFETFEEYFCKHARLESFKLARKRPQTA